MAIHGVLCCPSAVEIPAVLVNQVAEGHEYQALKSHVKENVDIGAVVCRIHVFAQETQTLVVPDGSFNDVKKDSFTPSLTKVLVEQLTHSYR